MQAEMPYTVTQTLIGPHPDAESSQNKDHHPYIKEGPAQYIGFYGCSSILVLRQRQQNRLCLCIGTCCVLFERTTEIKAEGTQGIRPARIKIRIACHIRNHHEKERRKESPSPGEEMKEARIPLEACEWICKRQKQIQRHAEKPTLS